MQVWAQKPRGVGGHAEKNSVSEIELADIARKDVPARCEDGIERRKCEHRKHIRVADPKRQQHKRDERDSKANVHGSQTVHHSTIPLPKSPSGRTVTAAIIMAKVTASRSCGESRNAVSISAETQMKDAIIDPQH